jgi:cytochrome c556
MTSVTGRGTLIAGAIFCLPLAASGLAWADASVARPADAIIETRQAGQDLVISLADQMKAAIAAKADVKPFADPAGAMSRWFHNFPTLFPAGTEAGHDTKAKPEVFSDAAGFAKAADTTSAAAARLSELAKAGDEAGFAAQFKVLGQSCGACHREYKIRE